MTKYIGHHQQSESTVTALALPAAAAPRSRVSAGRKTSGINLRKLAVAAVVVAALAVGIGGTLAFLHAGTDPVSNTFEAASTPDMVITETFNETLKSNVGVTVEGDVPVYVRAAVVITLQDDAGNTVPKVPVAGTDYSISYGSNWTLGSDGYFYYNDIITDGTTSNLINWASSTNTQYHLTIDILAQFVQAAGNTASAAWGLSSN